VILLYHFFYDLRLGYKHYQYFCKKYTHMYLEKLKFNKRQFQSIYDAGIEDFTKDQMKIVKRFNSGQNSAIRTQLDIEKEDAYLCGLVYKLSHAQGHVARALVLVPNKESVVRLSERFRELSAHTDLECLELASGLDQTGLVDRLESRVDVVFGTPGKVWNIFMSNLIKFNDLKHFIIDSIDQQFDQNYQGELNHIILEVPTKCQHLFFSEQFFEKPMTWITDNLEFVDLYRMDNHLKPIEQELVNNTLFETPNNHTKVRLVKNLVQKLQPSDKMLIYTRSSSAATLLSQYLEKNTIGSFGLVHNNQSDEKNEHDIEQFNNGMFNLLVCPHQFIQEIDLTTTHQLVNFDMPLKVNDFIKYSLIDNRIDQGVTFSFSTEEEIENWLELGKILQINFNTQEVPKDALVDEKKLSIIHQKREEKAQLYSKGNTMLDKREQRHAGPQNTRKLEKVRKSRKKK